MIAPESSTVGNGSTLAVNNGASLIANAGTTVPIQHGGALTIGPGEAITLGPGGSAGPNGLVGVAVVSPGVPTPATDPGLASAMASPGLAGTSGIQPQVNLDVLRDTRWDGLWDVLSDSA